jgi:hypothetical protein
MFPVKKTPERNQNPGVGFYSIPRDLYKRAAERRHENSSVPQNPTIRPIKPHCAPIRYITHASPSPGRVIGYESAGCSDPMNVYGCGGRVYGLSNLRAWAPEDREAGVSSVDAALVV